MQRINQMEPWFGTEERRAVSEYMSSGGWLTDFKKTREFERIICDYTDATYCSVVTSGTTALQIALMALGIGKGDRVIVPDYTMAATAYAVSLVGAEVVLVDIDRETLNIDVAKAQSKTDGAKCVMHVSINGRGYGIKEICDTFRGISTVVEDACQSLGSRYNGKHLGTFGEIGVLSFNTFKIISTGQGGALITNDKQLYEKIIRIKDYGRPSSRGSQYEMLGMNAKFTDLQAVIGIEQMKKLNWRVQKKQKIYQWYIEMLKGVEQVRFIQTNQEDCAPWYIDPLAEKRDGLIKHLDQNSIEAQPFYPPVHRLPYYSAYKDKKFPNSDYVSEHGIWLPSSSFLEQEDIERICSEIRRFYLS